MRKIISMIMVMLMPLWVISGCGYGGGGTDGGNGDGNGQDGNGGDGKCTPHASTTWTVRQTTAHNALASTKTLARVNNMAPRGRRLPSGKRPRGAV